MSGILGQLLVRVLEVHNERAERTACRSPHRMVHCPFPDRARNTTDGESAIVTHRDRPCLGNPCNRVDRIGVDSLDRLAGAVVPVFRIVVAMSSQDLKDSF